MPQKSLRIRKKRELKKEIVEALQQASYRRRTTGKQNIWMM